MHLNQSGVVYQTRIPRKRNNNMIVGVALAVVASMSGCTGLNNSIPQALGINSAARVPPPGTGSFATPNNYTNNGSGANGNSAPGATPPAIGNKTSQFNPVEQPASQLLSTINNAQSRIQQVTGQARDTVNRTAESINSGVETAGGRIDRFGQGVVQAGAILSEAAQPVSNINDQVTNNFAEDPNAAWRKPTR